MDSKIGETLGVNIGVAGCFSTFSVSKSDATGFLLYYY